MAWLYYLLEANLYLLTFYGFYRLFLQHETFYNSNRYYLLLTSLIAFLLPILQLGLLKPRPIVENFVLQMPVEYANEAVTRISTAPVQEAFNFVDYLYPLYLCIALCFAIKLTIGISKIIKLWLKAKKLRRGQITLVELDDQAAFSFFNLLFIHPHLATKQTVLNHEMVHITQKHSFDILFFELLQIICWFNPILYFIKKDIKLLHEYIADELSTGTDMQKHEYAMFLIENSFGLTPTALTNQIFNQSILKRRINMLNKKRTAGWARLKLLVVLPLAGGMLCMSTMAFTKDYGYVDLLPEKSSTILSMVQDPVKVEDSKKQEAPKFKTAQKGKVKFPPPLVRRDPEGHFYPLFNKDAKTKEIRSVERRFILINGQKVKDLATFYGVKNAKNITYLDGKAAISKYGNAARFGAVEITGTNIQMLKSGEMPPPPLVDVVRFPPPKVKQLKFKTKKIDSVGIINLKIKPDSLKMVTLNLKPTLRLKTIPLKLKSVSPIKTRTISPVKLNVIPSVRKIDTVKLMVYNNVEIKTKPRNLPVKRDANRNVNIQIDSTGNRNRNTEVLIKKTEPLKVIKFNEVKIEPTAKN